MSLLASTVTLAVQSGTKQNPASASLKFWLVPAASPFSVVVLDRFDGTAVISIRTSKLLVTSLVLVFVITNSTLLVHGPVEQSADGPVVIMTVRSGSGKITWVI